MEETDELKELELKDWQSFKKLEKLHTVQYNDI
jgi:hypothetical protein